MSESEDGVTLGFINVDIKEVAQAVLGDMLGYNYMIAPGLQGPITVKFNRPIPKDDVLSTLSTIFKMNGAAIVQADDVVKVVALAEAPRLAAGAAAAGPPRPGYGLEVAALRYTSADDMRKILEPIAPANAIVAVEAGRNILVLAGTEDERTSLLSVIEAFDVDWLAGMSFGFFPLQEASAKTIVGELWEVLGGSNGPLSKVVRLVPFDRLNTVLAISAQPQYLEKIRVWVGKLDVNSAPADRKILDLSRAERPGGGAERNAEQADRQHWRSRAGENGRPRCDARAVRRYRHVAGRHTPDGPNRWRRAPGRKSRDAHHRRRSHEFPDHHGHQGGLRSD